MSNNTFPPNSRYHDIEITEIEKPNGDIVRYLRRRFIPSPDRFQLLQEHTVVDGQRPDHIAAAYLGDPEQFWRICDANGAMKPDDLTKTGGSKLRITLPEGIPGSKDV